MSILALQQRLVEVGRIRMGEKRTSQSGKQYPAKLATWRLTSPDRKRLDAVAATYGGTVQPWEDQFEIITMSAALDIALIPGQALSQHMELWGQEKPKGPIICLRRCDGERELLKDRACPCKVEAGDDGDLACKPTTHLMVMLRRVPGIGSWRLSTHGWYAAQELLGTAGLLEQLTARGQLVPARLRLDQRTVVKADGNKNFVVPVIDIDVALDDVFGGSALGMGGPRSLPAPAAELEAPKPAPFTPVPVEVLPPAPTASTRDQLTAPTPERRARANAAEPIRSTGMVPRGGAVSSQAVLAGGGGGVGGQESAPSGEAPSPSTPAEHAEGTKPGVVSADPGAEHSPPAAAPSAVLDDAQRVAMWCADAGIGDDRRGALLHAFCGVTSARDVPEEKRGELRDVLDRIKAGVLELMIDEHGQPLLRLPGSWPASNNAEPAGEPAPASIMWKHELGKIRGIGEAKLLIQARKFAEQAGLVLPTTLDEIPHEIDGQLRGWLAERSAA